MPKRQGQVYKSLNHFDGMNGSRYTQHMPWRFDLGFFRFDGTISLGTGIGPTPIGRLYAGPSGVKFVSESAQSHGTLTNTPGLANLDMDTGLGGLSKGIEFDGNTLKFSKEDLAGLETDTGTSSKEIFHASSGAYNSSYQAVFFDHNGTQFAALGDQSGDGISVYQISTNGSFVPKDSVPLPTVTGLANVTIDGATFLLAASGQGNSITTYSVGNKGALTAQSTIGSEQYLPISTPEKIATVQSGPDHFAILASAGSSSLTVLKIEPNGALVAMDQVVDDKDTRFQGIDQLEVFEVDGRAYVLAAGQDDGISLFTVLPTGNLVHLETLIDDAEMPIAGLADMKVSVDGSQVHLFTLGAADNGIGQFTLDLGVQGLAGVNQTDGLGTHQKDVLIANNSGQILKAKNDADILVDGAGGDVLFGGWGYDLFVLSEDGADDTIADFQPGADSLDFSDLQFYYSADQLDVTPLDNGAIVKFGAETLYVYSMRETPLYHWHFTDETTHNASHVDVTFSETDWLIEEPVAKPNPVEGEGVASWLYHFIQNDGAEIWNGSNTLQNSVPDGYTTDTHSQTEQMIRDASGLFPSQMPNEDIEFEFRTHDDETPDRTGETDLMAQRGLDGRFDALDIRTIEVDGETFTELAFDDQVIRVEDINAPENDVTDFWFY